MSADFIGFENLIKFILTFEFCQRILPNAESVEGVSINGDPWKIQKL